MTTIYTLTVNSVAALQLGLWRLVADGELLQPAAVVVVTGDTADAVPSLIAVVEHVDLVVEHVPAENPVVLGERAVQADHVERLARDLGEAHGLHLVFRVPCARRHDRVQLRRQRVLEIPVRVEAHRGRRHVHLVRRERLGRRVLTVVLGDFAQKIVELH